MFSERIQRMEASATVAMNDKVTRLKREGRNIINMSVGEPDFNVPDNIKEAAKRAIDENYSKYTPTPGLHELREVICEKLQKDNGISYTPDEICVSNGAKQNVFNTTQILLDAGDEVVIPLPQWVTYSQTVRYTAANPVFVQPDEENKISAEDLEKALNNKTKLVILNSPSNPSGVVYTKQEIKKFADAILQTKAYVLADEIYEKVIYDEEHFSIASIPEMKDRTITINGFSKAYCMTGWRIGYSAAPTELTKQFIKLQSQETVGSNSIAQRAAIEAIQGPQDAVKQMVKEYRKRRDYLHKELNAISTVSCAKPSGAFYCFPNVGEDSMDFCNKLLDQGVATVPGVAFGIENHVRFSYAIPTAQLEEAMDRLRKITH